MACGPDRPDAPPADGSNALEPPASAPGSRGAADADAGPAESASAVPRVVFIGTSLTAGYGLADPLSQSWPARTAELAREAGIPIELVNAGVSGDTSAGGVRRIGALLGRPTDVVVIELGANDGLRGLQVEALRSNLAAVVDTVRRLRPESRIVLVPMEAPRNLGDAYVESFRSVYTDLGARQEVTLAPFLLDGVAGDPRLNQADGLHPTSEGHRIMARTLWSTLRPLLEDVSRTRDNR